MKLTEWYNKTSDTKKNLFLLGLITFAGFAATFIFFFNNNPGVPLGWLLGSIIELICYLSIVKGTAFMLDPSSLDRKKGYLAPLFMFMRLGLYAGGLILAGFATFRWGSMSSSYLNFFAVFAGYMPMVVLLLIVTFGRLKKAKPIETEAPKVEDEEND